MKTSTSILLAVFAFAACSETAPVNSPAPKKSSGPAAAAGTNATSQPSTAEPKKEATPAPAASQPAEKKVDPKVGLVPRMADPGYDYFGDGVAKDGDAISVAALAGKAKDHAGKRVRLSGTVQSVCKKKGCWMVLAAGDDKVRVKFKDYGFFMPLDCEGRECILEGTFAVQEVSIAMRKHLLEDAGKHDEAAKIDKPTQEMSVVAEGVAMRKR
ncbi:MAG: DUF4920 domain-containing protein [Planctomycetes bacterium]|nr:DUF4920 domain-containing protein [Planctomycetota bacterium]